MPLRRQDNPYHYSLTTRLKQGILLRFLSPLSPDDLVLDVGCGLGYFSRLVGERGARVCGLDLSVASLQFARRCTAGQFVAGSAPHLPFRSDTFTKVLFTDVIEHLHDDKGAVREIARVARNGAAVVVSTAALEGLLTGSRLNRLFHDREGTPEYHVRTGYSAQDLAEVLRRAGMQVTDVRYSTVLLGEAAIELLKLVYARLGVEFATQADALGMATSPLFAVYRTLVFPPLLALGMLENALLSPWLKGHLLIVRAVVHK